MSAQKKSINLLAKDKPESIGQKFLRWLQTIGRHFLVSVELVVILVFLFRFKIDSQLSEINEELLKKQAIVANGAKLENDFKMLQLQLEAIDEIEKKNYYLDKILTELEKIIPLDVVLNELNLNQESIILKGTSLSSIGMATFLNRLKVSPFFKELDFQNISSQPEKENLLEFQIGAVLNL